MKNDLKKIYDWAEVNKMKFNANKFEQIIHGEMPGVQRENYLNPKGESIEIKNEIKDLGVLVSNDFRFRGHIEKITRIGRVKSGQILRAIKTRKARPMIKLFNSYVKSVLEYCNMVWNPNEQNLIEKVENVQRSFTSKIEELKEFDYYKMLKESKFIVQKEEDKEIMQYGHGKC